MTSEEWAVEYRRLLRAFNKSPNADQSEAYREALQGVSVLLVNASVTACIQQLKYWPSAADILERAVAARRGRDIPASWCRSCDGSGLLESEADRPVDRHLADAVQIIYLRSQRRSKVFPRPLSIDEAAAWVQAHWPNFGFVPTYRRCECQTGAV